MTLAFFAVICLCAEVLRWPAGNHFAAGGAAFICSKAEIWTCSCAAMALSFSVCSNWTCWRCFIAACCSASDRPFCASASLLLRGLNLLLHLGSGFAEFVHGGLAQNSDSVFQRRAIDIGNQAQDFIGGFGGNRGAGLDDGRCRRGGHLENRAGQVKRQRRFPFGLDLGQGFLPPPARQR